MSIVDLSIKLVLDAGCSLRGAAAVLALFAREKLFDFDVPCFSTIRAWILRIGHYALTRPLDSPTPWVWLIDHTMQIGTVKMFVILGCPLNRVPFGERPLQLSDLQLVAMVPMETSDAKRVDAELERAVERTGKPHTIVSDQGRDWVGGTTKFRDFYRRAVHVADVAHSGANVLENAWKYLPRWNAFVKNLQETSGKVRQTTSAYLLGPKSRTSARFMNVDRQLRFAGRVLAHWDGATPQAKAVEYYGWLKDFRADLVVWQREHGLVETTKARLRVDGLHVDSLTEMEAEWGEIGTCPSTVKIAARLRTYIRTNQPTEAGVRLVASTEILESSYGKLKRIEREQSQSSMTGLVLSMGAIVGEGTQEERKEALEATPQKNVDSWVEKVLGHSMQWFRRQFFAKTKA